MSARDEDEFDLLRCLKGHVIKVNNQWFSKGIQLQLYFCLDGKKY